MSPKTLASKEARVWWAILWRALETTESPADAHRVATVVRASAADLSAYELATLRRVYLDTLARHRVNASPSRRDHEARVDVDALALTELSRFADLVDAPEPDPATPLAADLGRLLFESLSLADLRRAFTVIARHRHSLTPDELADLRTYARARRRELEAPERGRAA